MSYRDDQYSLIDLLKVSRELLGVLLALDASFVCSVAGWAKTHSTLIKLKPLLKFKECKCTLVLKQNVKTYTYLLR